MKNQFLAVLLTLCGMVACGASLQSGSGTGATSIAPLVVDTDGSISENTGNARGDNTFDLQLIRDNADEVCQARSSFIQGESNQIDGDASTQYGDGAHSVVMGNYNTVTDSEGAAAYGGTLSFIFGDSNLSDGGYQPYIFGASNSHVTDGDLGWGSWIFGNDNTVGATATGNSSEFNFLFGKDHYITETDEYNFLFGSTLTTGGGASSRNFVFGASNHTGADAFNNFIFGKNITLGTGDDAVFIIRRPEGTIRTYNVDDIFLVQDYENFCVDNAQAGATMNDTTGCDLLVTGGSTTVKGAFTATTSINTGTVTTDDTVITRTQVTPDTVTVANDATPASLPDTTTNISVLSASIRYTCNDVDGCDENVSETGAVDGDRVCITNVGTYDVNMKYNDGQLNINGGGDLALGTWDNICLEYNTDRWVMTSKADN